MESVTGFFSFLKFMFGNVQDMTTFNALVFLGLGVLMINVWGKSAIAGLTYQKQDENVDEHERRQEPSKVWSFIMLLMTIAQ